MKEVDYDLAILHIVDAGTAYGRRLRLTKKAEPGEIGTDVVFEFEALHEVEDLIEQLKSAAYDAWGEEADVNLQ